MALSDNLADVREFLATSPLVWLTVTVGAFLIGDFVFKACKRLPLLNPVATSILMVSLLLILTGTPYDTYFEGAKFIHFLLGPATVALAIPIYHRRTLIAAQAKPIFAALVIGALFAITVTYTMAALAGLDRELVLTLLPRNVTAPISMAISDLTGGIPSLTGVLTIATGIVGAAFGAFVLDMVKLTSPAARGFGLGLASHGIGTAYAFNEDETTGAFAAVAMGLSGIFTAFAVVGFIAALRI